MITDLTPVHVEDFAAEIWRAYQRVLRSPAPVITWQQLKPEVQQEFRRYALTVLTRQGKPSSI